MQVDDDELLLLVRQVLKRSPFHTEGVKKVHLRLRHMGYRASRERVNRVMRQAGLLSPQRCRRAEKHHDGTIIPETVNRIWGTDATMLQTTKGQRLWLFALIDHYSAEILGWHIVPVGQGTRWAALEPVKQAVSKIFGRVDKGVCSDLALRHDWGPQYAAKAFGDELKFLGITNSPGFEHEPETNGVIERFFRTAKEECLYVEYFSDLDDARERVSSWMQTYNTQWLIGRLGTTPRATREAIEAEKASAIA